MQGFNRAFAGKNAVRFGKVFILLASFLPANARLKPFAGKKYRLNRILAVWKGVYFARDSAYSAQDQYASPDKQVRTIFSENHLLSGSADHLLPGRPYHCGSRPSSTLAFLDHWAEKNSHAY